MSIELTGILVAPDDFGRLRLCLVDVLPSRERDAVADGSWARLKQAVPYSSEYSVPYDLPQGGAPDDAGIRGECWITLPDGRSRESRGRRDRILALAKELRGKEVAVRVRPKRFAFDSGARHNDGAHVAGTALVLETLEALGPPASGI